MYRMQLGFALAAAIGAGGWWTPGQELASLQVAQDAAAPADLPPLASLVGDPADSLYRAAREALTRREFSRAADLFARIGSQYPKSGYAPDALYWQAFALYRVGGTAPLRRAGRATRSGTSASVSPMLPPRAMPPHSTSGSRASWLGRATARRRRVSRKWRVRSPSRRRRRYPGRRRRRQSLPSRRITTATTGARMTTTTPRSRP